MTTMSFFTDPHIGLNRQAHTTEASRRRLRQAVYEVALKAGSAAGTTVCLGDLFDTWDNDETTIAQGHAVASFCDLVLAGNHDEPNREGKISSLQLLAGITNDVFVRLTSTGDFGYSVHGYTINGVEVNLVSVPHHASQELFQKGLVSTRAGHRPSAINLLLLHCNYEMPWDMTETTLNLTREDAARLLGTFDCVLLGHEHISRTDFDGRLVVLGNTHPTSFADISDKYTWVLDTATRKVVKHTKLWDASVGYQSVTWQDLLASTDVQQLVHGQFVEVVGDCKAGDMPAIARAIVGLWKSCDHLLMVRNKVSVAEAEVQVQSQTELRRLDVPARVRSELAGTPIAALWDQYVGSLQR